jgi:DNA-binding NarL/FixJ family response regulator
LAHNLHRLNSSAPVLTVNSALAGKETTVRLHSPFVGASMPTFSSVRVLVVDDFKPFRRFICSTLGERPDLQVIGEASDGLEAVQMAGELQPDLILLDIGLPNLDGLEAANRIRQVAPDAAIIFLTQQSDEELVRAALSTGARGYVLKTDAARELLTAVVGVLGGDDFVSSRIKVGNSGETEGA